MNIVFEHSREILEFALLSLVAAYFGLRSDNYWSAFSNVTGLALLWAFPAMLLDSMTGRDVIGMAYIGLAPFWGSVALIIRGSIRLGFRLRGRAYPLSVSSHESWLVVLPTWVGRELGRLNAKVSKRGKE